MKKTLTLLIIVSFFSFYSPAYGAIKLNTSTCVGYGANSTINDLSPLSIAVWVRQKGLTPGGRIVGKGTAGTQQNQFSMSNAIGDVRYIRVRTANTSYVTNDRPLAPVNNWIFMVVTYNPSASAGQVVNIYHNSTSSTSSLVESTYSTATDGSGTETAEGANLKINCNNANTSAFLEFAYFRYFNREISFKEAQQLYRHPMMYMSGTRVLSLPGYFNLSFFPDWSSYKNSGTLIGTLASTTTNPPINFFHF